MTDRTAELNEARKMFYEDETTDEQRVQILLMMREFAKIDMPDSQCVSCKQPGLGVPYEYALIEGHCYSDAGMRDYTMITRMCEYCFDRDCKFADPDDDTIPAVGPREKENADEG